MMSSLYDVIILPEGYQSLTC